MKNLDLYDLLHENSRQLSNLIPDDPSSETLFSIQEQQLEIQKRMNDALIKMSIDSEAESKRSKVRFYVTAILSGIAAIAALLSVVLPRV